MKPVEIAKRDRFGYDRTSTIRRDDTRGEMFPAETDPDFGLESFRGVFGSIEAAPDRIEMPVH